MKKATAVRHGLSVPFSRGLSQQAEAIAEAMAGPRRDAGTRFFTKFAAEAMIEVQRARLARAHLLSWIWLFSSTERTTAWAGGST